MTREAMSAPKSDRGDRKASAARPKRDHVPASRGLQLQNGLGNRAVARMIQSRGGPQSSAALPSQANRVIQAGSTISQPGDASEQEADRIADAALRMPEPSVPETSPVQAGERPAGIRSGTHEANSRVESALGRTGQPLPQSLRDDLEPRFGQDFSGVRVHSDRSAADSAKAMNARAYTSGRAIVFAEGQFAPGTSAGRRLLAHELAHVVQQNSVTPTSHSIQRSPSDAGTTPAPSQDPAPDSTPAPASDQPAPAPASDQPAPAPASDQSGQAKGILDGVTITSYADLASFCKSHVETLNTEFSTCVSEGVPVPIQLATAIKDGGDLATMTAAGGKKDVDEVTYGQVNNWFTSFTQAMSAAELARAGVAADKLSQLQASAVEAQATLLQIKEEAADKRQAAFLHEDESRLKQIVSWTSRIDDAILKVGPVIEESKEMINFLRTTASSVDVVGIRYEVPEGVELFPLLEKLSMLLAAAEIVWDGAEVLSGGTTKAAGAQAGIKFAVTVGRGIAAFVPLASGMAIEMGLFIAPMTEATLAKLTKLEDVARVGNKNLIEQGQYDLVNWNLEPGGRPVFNFMMAVMAASSPEDVPSSVPKEVASYFVSQRSLIAEGAADGNEGEEGKSSKEDEDVPTTGYLFWRKLDQTKIGDWVFNHRDNLWATFYGSAKPGAVQ